MALNIVMDEKHQLYARAESCLELLCCYKKTYLVLVVVWELYYCNKESMKLRLGSLYCCGSKPSGWSGTLQFSVCLFSQKQFESIIKERAFELSPELKMHAKTDPDLDPLRELAEFDQLIRLP